MPTIGIEPMASPLPRECSTPELRGLFFYVRRDSLGPQALFSTFAVTHLGRRRFFLRSPWLTWTAGAFYPALALTRWRSGLFRQIFLMERVMGIEPTSLAWKAKVLPLNYTRIKNGGGGWIRTSVLRENGFTVRRL